MAESSILAQANPSATTLTDMLTITTPPAIVDGIFVCNEDSVGVTVRVAVCPNGETIDPKHYLAYDTALGPGRTLSVDFPREGLRLGNGTVIRVYASTANVGFTVTGR